jgi:hypothetical protein
MLISFEGGLKGCACGAWHDGRVLGSADGALGFIRAVMETHFAIEE